MPDTQTTADRLIAEGAKPISRVCKLLGVHSASGTRWALHGRKMPDGTRIKLESFRCGSRLFTSEAALRRFVAKQNSPQPVEAGPRTQTARRRADAAAASVLDRLGV